MARRGGRKTDYQWGAFQGTILALDNAVGADGLGSTGFIFSQALTVTRIRGSVGVTLNPGGVGEAVMIRCGIIKVSENAFAAGSTAISNTFDDPGEDWIWMGHLYVSSGSEAAIVAASQLVDRVEIDTKAMRKVKPGETFAFTASVVASVDNGGDCDLLFSNRVLLGF